MSVCVVMGGKGQVGGALVNVLSKKHTVVISDLDEKPKIKNIDFLHVCIPWQDGFVEKVKAEAEEYKAKVVVIHSTVPVGTTGSIGENAVHSPVRGQHNDLERSLTKFVKYVAGKRAGVVKKHLEEVGIKCRRFQKPEESEFAKMMCLTRYLNDLAWYQTASGLCQSYGVNTQVILDWQKTYNDGYAGTKFVRPSLDFPNGFVGGHCVMQNSKIFQEQSGNEFIKRNIDVFRSQDGDSKAA